MFSHINPFDICLILKNWIPSKRPGRCIAVYTVTKEIDFPRCYMKCSRENVIQCGIFLVVSCFALHFMLYRGNWITFRKGKNTMGLLHKHYRACVRACVQACRDSIPGRADPVAGTMTNYTCVICV